MCNQLTSIFPFPTVLPGLTFAFSCMDLAACEVVHSGCRGEHEVLVCSWFLRALLGGVGKGC